LIAEKISDFFFAEFKKWSEELVSKLSIHRISGRGKQTCIFPFMNIEEYCSNICDKKWFERRILKDLNQFIPDAGHKND
jgi:hypothetical protein